MDWLFNSGFLLSSLEPLLCYYLKFSDCYLFGNLMTIKLKEIQSPLNNFRLGTEEKINIKRNQAKMIAISSKKTIRTNLITGTYRIKICKWKRQNLISDDILTFPSITFLFQMHFCFHFCPIILFNSWCLLFQFKKNSNWLKIHLSMILFVRDSKYLKFFLTWSKPLILIHF